MLTFVVNPLNNHQCGKIVKIALRRQHAFQFFVLAMITEKDFSSIGAYSADFVQL